MTRPGLTPVRGAPGAALHLINSAPAPFSGDPVHGLAGLAGLNLYDPDTMDM
jgi:hypothetical protein